MDDVTLNISDILDQSLSCCVIDKEISSSATFSVVLSFTEDLIIFKSKEVRLF